MILSPIVFVSSVNVDYEFYKYCQKYSCDIKEHEFDMRLTIFKQNFEKIRELNGKFNFTLALNKFALLSDDEFHNSKITVSNYKCDNLRYVKSNTKSVDWRNEGAVTPVKDQGSCGSCWAFSTVGAIEGWNKIQRGQLVNLSEQELVDCDRSDGGCSGGELDVPYDYITHNKGLCQRSDYAYEGVDATCDTRKCKTRYGNVNGCYYISPNNEEALRAAVDKGPVTVAIEADQLPFRFYNGGIFDYKGCGNNLDHGVLVVGYGEENGQKYWIVKNSWGEDWGENGYIRMLRSESESSKGICGIAITPVMPY
jgi:C1A family cysteine protease